MATDPPSDNPEPSPAVMFTLPPELAIPVPANAIRSPPVAPFPPAKDIKPPASLLAEDPAVNNTFDP